MFGLGMQEILIILALALIIIGPKKLPELAKTLGRAMGEFKRSAQEFKQSIDVEAAVNDLSDIESPDQTLADAIKDTQKKAEPSKAATPEDAQYPPDDFTGNESKTAAKTQENPESTQTKPSDNTDAK